MNLTNKAKSDFELWFYENYTNKNNFEHIRLHETERFYILGDFVQQAFIIKWMDENLNLWNDNFEMKNSYQESILKTITKINTILNV